MYYRNHTVEMVMICCDNDNSSITKKSTEAMRVFHLSFIVPTSLNSRQHQGFKLIALRTALGSALRHSGAPSLDFSSYANETQRESLFALQEYWFWILCLPRLSTLRGSKAVKSVVE
ncbi:hypothetical protein PAMP_019987 [Pampus punctatissimus]